MTDYRFIVITGCSSGIGMHAAKTLHQENWRVIATARKAQDIEKLSKMNIHAVLLDYQDSDSIEKCAQEILSICGDKLFAVIHNGAYGQPGAIEDVPVEALRQQFSANLFGPIELTQKLLPSLRQKTTSRIIFISSVLGLVAVPFRGAYTASKFALEGVADTLRLELSNTDISVSLIEPGAIESDFRKNALVKFQEHISPDQSVYKEQYTRQIERLTEKRSKNNAITGPEKVTDKIRIILNSNQPKARYFITKETYIAALLKRLLPTSLLDKLLAKF